MAFVADCLWLSVAPATLEFLRKIKVAVAQLSQAFCRQKRVRVVCASTNKFPACSLRLRAADRGSGSGWRGDARNGPVVRQDSFPKLPITLPLQPRARSFPVGKRVEYFGKGTGVLLAQGMPTVLLNGVFPLGKCTRQYLAPWLRSKR